MNPSEMVPRESYELALAQLARTEAYLTTLGGVVSALSLFVGYKLFGLVTMCVTAIQNNTAALNKLKGDDDGQG